jgi:hypothetical protein
MSTNLVHCRLEVLNIQRVVLLAMDPKILNLVERDGLILGGLLVWRLVALRISPKQGHNRKQLLPK